MENGSKIKKGDIVEETLVPEVVENKGVETVSEKELSVSEENSPIAMAQMLLDRNVDPGKIEKLLDIQERYQKIQAKKAYVESMANLKTNPPKILKDKKVAFNTSKGVTNYNHATLGNAEEIVTPWLASGGFSVSFPPQHDDSGKIKVTCLITHKLGHSEPFTLIASPDTTGVKNSIQAMGSTITYLQRYTLLLGCGLATHDQDDDGAGSGDPGIKYITEEQQNNIRDLLAHYGIDEKKFLLWTKCENIGKLEVAHYKIYIAGIEAKAANIKKTELNKKGGAK